MPASAEYDPEARALTIDLASRRIAGTVAFPDDEHLVDVDADGHAVSLEVLNVSDLKLEEMAARFGFEDRLPEVRAAASAVLALRTATSWSTFQIVQGAVALSTGYVELGRTVSASSGPTQEVDLLPA